MKTQGIFWDTGVGASVLHSTPNFCKESIDKLSKPSITFCPRKFEEL